MESETEIETNACVRGLMEVLREMWALLPEDPPPDNCFMPLWPSAEMKAVYRTVAGQAGLPKRCADRRCQRTGRCQGGPDTEHGQGCTTLWTDAEFDKHDIASLALILAWVREGTRLERLLEGPAAAADPAAGDLAASGPAAGDAARPTG